MLSTYNWLQFPALVPSQVYLVDVLAPIIIAEDVHGWPQHKRPLASIEIVYPHVIGQVSPGSWKCRACNVGCYRILIFPLRPCLLQHMIYRCCAISEMFMRCRVVQASDVRHVCCRECVRVQRHASKNKCVFECYT